MEGAGFIRAHSEKVELRNNILGPDPADVSVIPHLHRFHDADDEHPFVNSVYPVGRYDQIRQDHGRNTRFDSVAPRDVAKELAFVPDRQFKPCHELLAPGIYQCEITYAHVL